MPGQTDNWGPKCSGQMDSWDPHAQVSRDASNRHPITQDRQMPTANKHPAPTYTYSGRTDRHTPSAGADRQTPGIHTPRTDRKLGPPSAQDRRAPKPGTPGSPGQVGAVGGAPRGNPAPSLLICIQGGTALIYLHTGRGQLCMLRGPALADPVLGGGAASPLSPPPARWVPPGQPGVRYNPRGPFPSPTPQERCLVFFVKNGLSVPFLYKTQGSSRALDHQKPTAAA